MKERGTPLDTYPLYGVAKELRAQVIVRDTGDVGVLGNARAGTGVQATSNNDFEWTSCGPTMNLGINQASGGGTAELISARRVDNKYT